MFWILRPNNISVVITSKSLNQLKENIGSIHINLSEETLKELELYFSV